MKSHQFIIQVLEEKLGEYLEMAGDNAPALMIDHLARLLVKEQEEKEFYKNIYNRWLHECPNTAE
jgi:hypothetical protein